MYTLYTIEVDAHSHSFIGNYIQIDYLIWYVA